MDVNSFFAKRLPDVDPTTVSRLEYFRMFPGALKEFSLVDWDPDTRSWRHLANPGKAWGEPDHVTHESTAGGKGRTTRKTWNVRPGQQEGTTWEGEYSEHQGLDFPDFPAFPRHTPAPTTLSDRFGEPNEHDFDEHEAKGGTVRSSRKKWNPRPDSHEGAEEWSRSHTTTNTTTTTSGNIVELPANARSPRKSTSKSPTKSRAPSPAKAATSQKARQSPTEARFEKKLQADDAYGKALRAVDNKAYKAAKAGRDAEFDVPGVSDADRDRAIARGMQRAEDESALRELGSGKEQRVRDGYEERIVDLTQTDKSKGSRSKCVTLMAANVTRKANMVRR